MKRRIIVTVTFLAGLYYFLVFLLPPRIGGAPDSAGAYAATTAHAGLAEPEVLYSGAREGGTPRILRLAPGRRPGAVAVGPSPWRRDDYRGAERPQWVAPDRLYYIGLGWDDRTPRVCLARWRDGAWRPEPRAVLDRGEPGTADSSGVTWVSVLAPTAGEQLWRAWCVGRQGETGRVGYATSTDGVRWERAALAADAPHGGSIESVSVWRSGGTITGVIVERAAAGGTRLAVAAVDGASGRLGPLSAVHLVAPSGDALAPLQVLDARVSEGGPAPAYATLLVTCTRPDGRREVRTATLTLGPPYVASLAPRPLREAGNRGRSTLLNDVRGRIDDLVVVVGAFAVGLGLVSLAQVHGRRVFRRRQGWAESSVFFVAAAAMATTTIYTRLRPDADDWGSRTYQMLFAGLFQPLGSSMFSLLAAYLVSAAYRAFRVRNLESTLMAASAALIMLGQVPIGNLLTQWLPPPVQIPTVMAWVLFVTNNAVVRAVNFGIFVGAMATALRVWLSLDRAALRDVT